MVRLCLAMYRLGVRSAGTGFRGIAADPFDGGLWITNTNANRLIKLGPKIEATMMSSNRSILTDRHCRGFARRKRVDFGVARTPATRQVVKFSRRGDELVRIGGFSRFVSSISLDDRQGDVWVADRFANEVVRLTGTDADLNFYDASAPSGSRHVRVDGFDEPFSVSANPNRDGDGAGNAWAANPCSSAVVEFAGAVRLRACAGGVSSFRASPGRSGPSARRCLGPGTTRRGRSRYSSDGEELSFFRISARSCRRICR